MTTYSRNLTCLICLLSVVFFATSCSLFSSSKKTKPQSNPGKTQSQRETTTSKSPDVKKILQQGNAHLKAGRINKAIAAFQRAKQIDPDNQQAVQGLNDARATRQQLIEDHLHRGIQYFTQDQLEDAMREWNTILALDPKHEEALKYKSRTQSMLDALQQNN